jgi:hypothetical protein
LKPGMQQATALEERVESRSRLYGRRLNALSF